MQNKISKTTWLNYIWRLLRAIEKHVFNDENSNIDSNGENYFQQQFCRFFSTENFAVVDLGSNVGNWTKALYENGFKGHAVLVEAVQNSLDKAKVNLFEYEERCTFVQGVVTNSLEESATFYISNDEFSEKSSLYNQSLNNSKINLESKIIKTISWYQIKLILESIKNTTDSALKIDCEGAEYEIIDMFLSDGYRPRFIQFEFGHAVRGSSYFSVDIWKVLEGFGYSIYLLKKKNMIKINYSPYIDNIFRCANFVAIPNSEVDLWRSYIINQSLRM